MFDILCAHFAHFLFLHFIKHFDRLLTAWEQFQAQHNQHMSPPLPGESSLSLQMKAIGWIEMSKHLSEGKQNPRIGLNHSRNPERELNLQQCEDRPWTDLKQATFQGLAFASSIPNTRVRGTITLVMLIIMKKVMWGLMMYFHSRMPIRKIHVYVRTRQTMRWPKPVKCEDELNSPRLCHFHSGLGDMKESSPRPRQSARLLSPHPPLQPQNTQPQHSGTC